MSSLSRADMEQIIREGGSVRHKGKVITRVQDLPTEADLSEGSPDRMAAALADIDAKIAELEAQKLRLQAGIEALPKAKK